MIKLNTKPCSGINVRQTSANCYRRFWAVAYIGALALLIAGCGGSKSSSPPVTLNPLPGATSISPSSAPAGSRAVTLTVVGYGFTAGSIVRWNGASRTTSFVSTTQLTAEIMPSDLLGAGAGMVTVFNPAPGGGTSGSLIFTVNSVSQLSFLTALLPDAAHNKAYAYTLQASGGIPPYTWTITSGSLPSGLNLGSGGEISGTPPSVSGDTTQNFTIRLSDYAYQANTQTKPLSILVRAGGLGRNETCSTATPISNGVTRASISPYGDVDVYSFHGTAGNSVTIEIYAQRLSLYGDSGSVDDYLDSFLELLNSNCLRLYYNDDIDPGNVVDSLILDYTLPATGTYYIRVSDLRGDGRPDFIYELHLSGAD